LDLLIKSNATNAATTANIGSEGLSKIKGGQNPLILPEGSKWHEMKKGEKAKSTIQKKKSKRNKHFNRNE
jgi:hypothetical protein